MHNRVRRSVPIAVVTSLAFAWAVLWPDVTRAQGAAPATTAAPADDATLAAAKQHFEAGKRAYNANDFPMAIREFKAAEALRPSPILAYNIGLANEKLQRRRVAARYYKRYLEGAPAAANRAEVEGRIAQLEREIAAQPAAQPVEQPQDNPPPPPTTTAGDPNAQPQVQSGQDPYQAQAPMTTAPAQKKRNLWWVWIIVGVGGALLITGIVLGVYYGLYYDPYYYTGTVSTDRLRPLDRKEVYDRKDTLDRGVGMPAGQRNADVSPAFEIRF